MAESAIDHIYYSQTIKNIECKKLTQSSTDHLPILCEIRFKKPAARFVHEIRKRSYKTYTKEKWNECLAKKDRTTLDEQDLDSMVETFTKHTNEALVIKSRSISHCVQSELYINRI